MHSIASTPPPILISLCTLIILIPFSMVFPIIQLHHRKQEMRQLHTNSHFCFKSLWDRFIPAIFISLVPSILLFGYQSCRRALFSAKESIGTPLVKTAYDMFLISHSNSATLTISLPSHCCPLLGLSWLVVDLDHFAYF